jgi:hypothetical protein
MNEAKLKLSKEEINAARRADYAANIVERRAAAKAWRAKRSRIRRGLPPLETAPSVTTIQHDLVQLVKKIFEVTGLYVSLTVTAVER